MTHLRESELLLSKNIMVNNSSGILLVSKILPLYSVAQKRLKHKGKAIPEGFLKSRNINKQI